MKKKILGILLCCCFMTGCFKSDNMEDIKIKTTVYPIEYITSVLYGDHAEGVGSIYPDEISLENYKLTKKQLNDFSNNDLFIYNGTSNEPDYAIELLNINKNIKIIDAAKGMDYTYHVEELWLDPFNFLMLAQNIKSGFNEYVDDPYLMGEIEKNYDKLNIQVSALDVEFKEAIENASNKSIIVSDDVFKFLEKYGFNVISLEENENLNAKIVSDAKNLIKNGTIQYIFIKDNEEVNSTIQSILDSTDVETVSLHSLSILSEEDRKNELDYISIMKANIEKIRKELYK